MIEGVRLTSGDGLRMAIDGVEPLVSEIGPDAAAVGEGTGASGPHHERVVVRPMTPRPADREAGRRRFEVVIDGWRFEVTAEPAARARLRERAARTRESSHHGREVIHARIPGRVVRVWVASGDHVAAGQRLLAVEAMKMENEIRSSRSGTVESVTVSVGQTVELGDELVVVG
jgi:biotin carboxyl carrier protein